MNTSYTRGNSNSHRRALMATATLVAFLAVTLPVQGGGGDEPSAPAPDQLGPGISHAEFAKRRRNLAESLGENAVVLLAASEGKDLDTFVQGSDFYYLTGINEAGVSALLRNHADGYEEILFLQPHNPGKERWDGPRLHPGDQALDATGFAAARPAGDLPATLASWSEGANRLHLAGITREKLLQLLGNPSADMTMRSASKQVAALRQVKSPAEMAIFRRAVEITGAALIEAMRSAAPGQGEWELEAVIEYVFRRYGAERFGFPSIVGSGPNSCVLHYNANQRRMRDGDLVVCDVGAEYRRYTADVTRTFPVNGKFTPRQREIYNIVLAAQNAAIKAVRPGVTIRDVHRVAQKVIADAGHGRRFIHGTSHWIGLDVHDVGDYSRPLAPGMVLSVEPGIYIPEENIGVRIEDDVVVTESGCELISGGIPRDPDQIEKIMKVFGVGNTRISGLTPNPDRSANDRAKPRAETPSPRERQPH